MDNMNINFQGPVNAGSMIVGGRDVSIGGDINAAAAHGVDAPDLVRQLRSAIAALGLPAKTRSQTSTQLKAIENELTKSQPNKSSIADKLGKLTKVLTTAGAIATPAAGVAAIIARLASWLGDHGKSILAMLPT